MQVLQKQKILNSKHLWLQAFQMRFSTCSGEDHSEAVRVRFEIDCIAVKGVATTVSNYIHPNFWDWSGLSEPEILLSLWKKIVISL